MHKASRFFRLLGSELVKNPYDMTGLRLRRPDAAANKTNFAEPPTSGVHEHLNPTRDLRKDKDGQVPKRHRKFHTCGMKSKWVC